MERKIRTAYLTARPRCVNLLTSLAAGLEAIRQRTFAAADMHMSLQGGPLSQPSLCLALLY